MTTDTAPPTEQQQEAPEVQEQQAPETPETQEAPESQETETAESSDDLLDRLIDEEFGESEGGEAETPPRDEKGRFKAKDAGETQADGAADAPETDDPSDPEDSTPSEEGEAPPEPASRRVLKPKVDKEVREIDIDEWYSERPDEFTDVVQKGLAFEDATQRRYTSGVQDIVNALSAQGYSVVRDTLAPGGVRVVPPAATTPQETQAQNAPEADDPVTTLGSQIEELEAQIKQSEAPTAADFLRLQKLQRQLAAAQTEAIRAEQEKFRQAQEQSRTKAQQEALAQEFQRRVGGLIKDRSSKFGDHAEELAAEASQIALGRMHTARTIEEVEQTLKEHFDRWDRMLAARTPAPEKPDPNQNGRDVEPRKEAATTPPPKTQAPPRVGASGSRPVGSDGSPFDKAKHWDDVSDDDWKRLFE